MVAANEVIQFVLRDSDISIERLQRHSMCHKRTDIHNSSLVMGL